jgi:phosphohistidine phosphatase
MAGTPHILTLVRHAKSDWGEAGLPDFERPLSARGERDAPDMAVRTRESVPPPTLIISSPAVRALVTAKLFARAFKYLPHKILHENRVYEATASQLLEVVRAHGGRQRHVMLFGHNPGISDFAARLANDAGLADQPTGAVVSLAVPVRDWSALDWGTCRLRHHDWPKKPRGGESVRRK